MINRIIRDHKTILLIIVCILFTDFVLNAQNMNKEVFVVRPYEPTLSDAAKYNFLPPVTSIESTIPAFQYSISPKRIQNGFEPDPIKAARTVTTSLPKIYNSWIKLGLGNYSTPLVEFNISNVRSKDYALGAYMHHKSSHSNLRLENDVKVNAGYVDNFIKVYGKRFFSAVTLSGGLNFEQHAFNYYGYNTELLPGPYDINKDSVRQRNYKPGIVAGIKSNYSDPEKLSFDIQASYDYFIDKQKNAEPDFVIQTNFSKMFAGIMGGLDMSLDYSRLSQKNDTVGSPYNNTIFRFNPWIGKTSEDWQFKLGFEAAADIADLTNFYFYPRANLDIIVIKDVLVPFIGVSGELQKNNYQNLFNENMFIKPGLTLKNSSNNFMVYAGLKGNISSVIRFRADASLSLFKDFHFFVNDTFTRPFMPPLQNQFTAVYDDVSLITYHGQLVFAPGKNLELTAEGKYFDYRMIEEVKPWHKPNFTVNIAAKYRYEQFEFGAGFNIIGERWVKVNLPDSMKKLKPVFDANLSINYHYSKVLTLFADFYNLAERSYLIWNQYPSQRFNFLIGFSYKL